MVRSKRRTVGLVFQRYTKNTIQNAEGGGAQKEGNSTSLSCLQRDLAKRIEMILTKARSERNEEKGGRGKKRVNHPCLVRVGESTTRRRGVSKRVSVIILNYLLAKEWGKKKPSEGDAVQICGFQGWACRTEYRFSGSQGSAQTREVPKELNRSC